MDEMSYYWIAGAVFVLSMIVQQKLKSTYRTVTWALFAPRPWVRGCWVLA